MTRERERGRGFDREWVGAQYEGQADNLRARGHNTSCSSTFYQGQGRGHNTRAPAVEGRPTFYQHITVLYFSVTYNPHINPNINTRAPAVEGRPTFYQGQEQYRDSKLECSTSILSINCKIHQMKIKIRRSSVLASVRKPITPTKWAKTL